MTAWNNREELVHQVITLRQQQMSLRAISRSLLISRNTVKSLLKDHDKQRNEEHCAIPKKPSRAPKASKLDPYKERVDALLKKYPDATAQRVFEILRGEGFEGGYTRVKKHVRLVRPKPKVEPSKTSVTYGPGEMSESDWTPYDITYTTGLSERIQVFGYVLPFSTRRFYRGFTSYDLHAQMDGHVGAFKRFGGLAAITKYDGQKVVALRWEGHQPIYNPRFLAFAAHYEFRPLVLRGNPNARPNVERGFWTSEQSFLNAREFRDLDDFNQQLEHWMDTVNDPRPRHGTNSLERFAEEAPHLLPLPQHNYDTARVIYRLCNIDGFVDWQGNRYAVPYDHITDILPVRITRDELFVYSAELEPIARHELVARGQGLQLDPLGFHQCTTRRPAISLDQVKIAFERMGEQSGDFFRRLSSGPPRQWGAGARKILLLRERYATEALDAALGHAARFGALRFEDVQRVLEATHPPRTLDEYVAEDTALRLEKELGMRRTEPRDLREFDRLPVHSPPAGHDSSAKRADNQEESSWQETPTEKHELEPDSRPAPSQPNPQTTKS